MDYILEEIEGALHCINRNSFADEDVPRGKEAMARGDEENWEEEKIVKNIDIKHYFV